MKKLSLNTIIIFAYLLITTCINAQAKEIATAELLFSGNVIGNIIPCIPCSGSDTGGIARRAYMIKTLKKKKEILLMDTGNLLLVNDKKKYEPKRKVMVNAMERLGYDALGLGINEIAAKTDFLPEQCRKKSIAMISANIHSADGQFCIAPYIIKEINGIKIAVTSVMPLKHIQGIKPNAALKVKTPDETLGPILKEMNEKADFTVLLSTDTTNKTRILVNEIPGIDLAVCAVGNPPRLPTHKEITADKPMVFSFLNRGIELGTVKLGKDSAGTRIRSMTRTQLTSDVRADQEMLSLIEDYLAELRYISKERAKEKELEQKFMILKMSPQEFIKQYKNKFEE